MEANGQTGLDDCGLYQFHQIGAVGIAASTLGHLQDHRSLQLGGSTGNTLNDLHIVHIECADGVAALIGFFKHFLRSNQRHNCILLFIIIS